MKTGKTITLIALMCVASVTALAACNQNTKTTSASETADSSVQTDSIFSESSIQGESTQNEFHSSDPETTEVSGNTGSSIPEISLDSDGTFVYDSSVDGYNYDDESYEEHNDHESSVDDPVYDSAFKKNSIDTAYNEAIKDASAENEMRAICQEYTGKWKAQVDEAYNELLSLSGSYGEKTDAIVNEQNEWSANADAAIQSFYTDASDSFALLEADSKVYNFYRSRAYDLYKQIYDQTGKVEF